MRVITKSGILAAVAVVGIAAGSASAAVIDFTASSSTSGSIGGVGWSLTPSAGDTITFVDSDAPGPIGGLAGLNDGVGLNNDEITEGTEYLTVTFSRKVRLSAFYALDLFKTARDEDDPETAMLFVGGTPTGSPSATLAATEVYTRGGFGFGSKSVSVFGDTFTFAASNGNDGVGKGDFALAGLEIASIPVPAAGLMLGAGLLGFGLMRRRR